MIKYNTTVNHIRRETTVAAIHSQRGELISETRKGTGARVKAALEKDVRALASSL
ncbi:hypothetical protein [Hymenobacter pini]|uniref:hypothetical protein n=1 Tax=Hymenobacter pini TaxID=2880879 RepID=UPI001CF28BAD|nr:hypothetical protein [Hymenobacter pini]MCA8829405.1 hypothetical protein [Hymenobacter pini]